jgi:putative sigma-54 modulation protein
MQLQVKGRNLEVSETILRFAEAKLRKLDRQIGETTRVELELSVEKNPSIAANQIAEATIFTKGPNLRARAASKDMRAAIDSLYDKLARQVKEHREKLVQRHRTPSERD